MRIAHHEPIWKSGELLEETRDRPTKPARAIIKAAPVNGVEAVERLSLLDQRTLEILSWCSPALANIHKQSESHAQFQMINSSEGIATKAAETSLSGGVGGIFGALTKGVLGYYGLS